MGYFSTPKKTTAQSSTKADETTALDDPWEILPRRQVGPSCPPHEPPRPRHICPALSLCLPPTAGSALGALGRQLTPTRSTSRAPSCSPAGVARTLLQTGGGALGPSDHLLEDGGVLQGSCARSGARGVEIARRISMSRVLERSIHGLAMPLAVPQFSVQLPIANLIEQGVWQL